MATQDSNSAIDTHFFSYLKYLAGEDGEIQTFTANGAQATAVYTGTPLSFNRVFGANFGNERRMNQIINRVREYYREKNSQVLWLVRSSSSKSSRLGSLLSDSNFPYQLYWQDMVLCINLGKYQNIRDQGHDVITISNEEQFKTWLDIFCKGFNYEADKTAYEMLFKNIGLDGSSPHKYYLGYYEGRPASACFTYADSDITGLYCLTTLGEFRGKGCATAVIYKILMDAISKNCKILFTQADQESKSFYEKRGFKGDVITKIYGFKP